MTRLSPVLRLIASAALLVTVVAFFYRPLYLVLGPEVLPTAYRLGLPALFQRSSAPGFVLQITSRPPGAAVLVDGVPRGTTPSMLNVVCSEGKDVALTLRKEGLPDFQQTFTCREGLSARANIDLTR